MTENNQNSEGFVGGFASVDEFSKAGIKSIIEATKSFQGLPQPGAQWELQKSYPEFSRAMKNCRLRMIPIISSLLQHAKVSTVDFKSRDVEEKFDFIVDANDDILERIGSALDEASGTVNKTEAIVINPSARVMKPPGTWGKRKASKDMMDDTRSSDKSLANQTSSRLIKKAFHRIKVSEKPQLKFSTPVDNSVSPFIPKLMDKPNSIKPLSILPEYTAKNEEFFGHPYQIELDRWEPTDHMLQKVMPKLPKKLLATPLNKVYTVSDVKKMVHHLRTVTEMAVDVEHHSYRTFLGLTCLLQISTREQDFVIDTLELRDHLQCLNEVFTKSSVVKVLHGATSDIEWLQRDLGLYVVGMFDTGIAAKQLGHPQQSLQFLLNHYCSLQVDKSFQLADWRIRPLPDDMLHYARQDTHNLMYLYDVMKNELIEAGNKYKNLLISVYDQSRIICSQRYEKPTNNPQLSLRKSRRTLNNRQLYAYTELFLWRDAIAREKDESLGYILPGHMLLGICEALPKEMTGILACCDPVPPLVHCNLGVIHRIVLKARDLPLREEASHQDKPEKREKQKDWVILMNSIHDVSLNEIERVGDPENQDENQSSTNMDDPSKVKVWPLEGPSLDLTGVQLLQTPSKGYISRMVKIGKGKGQNKERAEEQEVAPNPFERYQLSKKIIDLLKDPERHADADLNNPLVKAVYDTLVYDPDQHDDREKQLQPDVPLAKILPDKEYVPFNPFSSKTLERNPKKKRKVKNEPWQESFANGNENTVDVENGEDVRDIVDVEEGEIFICSGEDSDTAAETPSSSTTPFISVSHEDKRSKNNKKKKNNIINKLNFMSKKRKNQQNESNCQDGNDQQMNYNKKRKMQQNSSPKNYNHHHQKHSPQNQQKSKNKNSAKKKSGFFSRFNKDGKSITFK